MTRRVGRSHAARRPSRRERRRNETLEKLLIASLELFGTKGFAATTVEEITEAADVGKGTFFNYFPSKQHVLGYFAERQLGHIRHYLELSDGDGHGGIHAVLRGLARELIKVPSRSPEMARTVVTAFLGDADVRQYVSGFMEEGREMVAEMMRHGQRTDELRSDIEAPELARIFQQTVMGTILLWSLQPKVSVSRMLDGALDVLLAGVRPQVGSRSRRGGRKEAGR